MHCKPTFGSVLLICSLSLLCGTNGFAQTIDVEYAKGKQYVTEGADIRKDQAVYPAADLVAMMPEDFEDGDFIGKYVLMKDIKPLKRGVVEWPFSSTQASPPLTHPSPTFDRTLYSAVPRSIETLICMEMKVRAGSNDS